MRGERVRFSYPPDVLAEARLRIAAGEQAWCECDATCVRCWQPFSIRLPFSEPLPEIRLVCPGCDEQ